MNFWQSPVTSLRALWRRQTPKLRQLRHWYSPSLDREVDIDVYLPPDYRATPNRDYPLLVLNDGQDLPRMGFSGILEQLYRQQQLPYLIVVAVHAGPQRIREYGTARQPDYKNRGDKAPRYRDFLLEELLPFVSSRFRVSYQTEQTAIAGFSLGGLSALDIGWSAPHIFGAVGVFSGALWWRWSPVDDANPDADRIIHYIIRTSPDERPNDQVFWFQCGTLDEDSDRNNNGIIDAIDDTHDCLHALRHRGYHESQLRYLEIPNGTHDPQTWGVAMPDFLRWTFVSRHSMSNAG
jgi:enterochelin esterase-like enzyme